MPFSERSYRDRMREQLELEIECLEKVFTNNQAQIIDLLGTYGLTEQQSRLTYNALLENYREIVNVISLGADGKASPVDLFDNAFKDILESFYTKLRAKSPFPPAREGEEDPLSQLIFLLSTSYDELKEKLQKKTQQGLDRKPDVITPFPSQAKK